MPLLSQTHHFLQSPSFRQAQFALIGQLTQCIVIGRIPQARGGNVTPLTIIASFSFQVNFISSIPKGEPSCVTVTVMMLVCICSTQAMVKTISYGLYVHSAGMWLCSPHTHTTRYAQNSTFEQSIANIWTNTAVTETTPSLFAWTFGLHYANISTAWHRHVGACLNEPF